MLHKLWFNLAYFYKPIWDTGISPPELLCFIATHPPGVALDCGCGTGTNVIALAKHGWNVIGVDFSKRAIQIAQKKAKQYEVEVDLHVDDVTRLDNISGPFDLILDIGCFHSLPSNARHLYTDKIDHLLAISGSFLLYLFFKHNVSDRGPGVTEDDIHLISKKLHLVHRIDSSERGIRPSAWMTYQKHN